MGVAPDVRPPFCFCLLRPALPQVEINFDVQCDIHRNATLRARSEFPFFESVDRIFIASKAKTAHDAGNIDGSVFPDNRFKNNRSLISGFPRFLGILWLNARQNRRWTYAAA